MRFTISTVAAVASLVSLVHADQPKCHRKQTTIASYDLSTPTPDSSPSSSTTSIILPDAPTTSHCATVIASTPCATAPTTAYHTATETCSTVVTQTLTSGGFTSLVTVTSTELVTSTVTATSGLVSTSTSTSTLITTSTISPNSTVTTTVVATVETVSTAVPPPQFTPVHDSLPGSSTVNQKRKRRAGFSSLFERAADSQDASDVDVKNLQHEGDVNCYVASGNCTATTVTETVSATDAVSTSTTTVTSTITTTEVPSATSTSTVITTVTDVQTITGSAGSAAIVTATSTTVRYTSTTYPACDPTNVANRVSGEVAAFVRYNDTNAVSGSVGTVASAYDCCAVNLHIADSALWLWNSNTTVCYSIQVSTCKGPQADNDQATLVVRPGSFGYTFGNAYCGQWSYTVEA